MAPSSFPFGGSLVIDGPLFLDFNCTVTVTVGMSGTFTFIQDQVAPDLILVDGLSDTDIELDVQNISLASCGLSGIIFDAVYPLISGFVNGAISGTMQAAINVLAEGYMQELFLGMINEVIGAVPVCAP
jgi:hypothetical protein